MTEYHQKIDTPERAKNAYGLYISVQTADIRKFLDGAHADNVEEVHIAIDGEERTMTFAEFKQRLLSP